MDKNQHCNWRIVNRMFAARQRIIQKKILKPTCLKDVECKVVELVSEEWKVKATHKITA